MDMLAMRQIEMMKKKHPQFEHYRDSQGVLIFKGKLQPQKNMPVSTVYIEYIGAALPKVWVTDPVLIAGTPHIYRTGNLCLYKPTNFEWTAGKPLADYIVPWTSSWLYFYEVWKTKHKWYGPEASHDNTLEK